MSNGRRRRRAAALALLGVCCATAIACRGSGRRTSGFSFVLSDTFFSIEGPQKSLGYEMTSESLADFYPKMLEQLDPAAELARWRAARSEAKR